MAAGLLAFTLTFLTSCKETSVRSEFDDWQHRNDVYTDSLAARTIPGLTPETAEPGQLFRLLSYTVDPTVTDWDDDYYVYCSIIERGTGTVSPLSSDSVYINYRVRLIPSDSYPQGYVTDQSYKTVQMDPTENVPAVFTLSNLINGQVTAIQEMKEGDIWRIYVPYRLGYSNTKKGEIPAYSNLIFDVGLVRFTSQR